MSEGGVTRNEGCSVAEPVPENWELLNLSRDLVVLQLLLFDECLHLLNLPLPTEIPPLEPLIACLLDLLPELLQQQLRVVKVTDLQLLLMDVILVVDAVSAKAVSLVEGEPG